MNAMSWHVVFLRKPWLAVILFTRLAIGSSVPALARTDDAGSAARDTAGMATVAQDLARREDGYGACPQALNLFAHIRLSPIWTRSSAIVGHPQPVVPNNKVGSNGRLRLRNDTKKARPAIGAAPLLSHRWFQRGT